MPLPPRPLFSTKIKNTIRERWRYHCAINCLQVHCLHCLYCLVNSVFTALHCLITILLERYRNGPMSFGAKTGVYGWVEWMDERLRPVEKNHPVRKEQNCWFWWITSLVVSFPEGVRKLYWTIIPRRLILEVSLICQPTTWHLSSPPKNRQKSDQWLGRGMSTWKQARDFILFLGRKWNNQQQDKSNN